LNNIVKYTNEEAVDLLEKMIVFNPAKRITIEEVINHPYTNSIKEEGVSDPLFNDTINFDFD
jgi:serine/threonine protein kinase